MKKVIIAIILATQLLANCYFQVPLKKSGIPEKEAHFYHFDDIYTAPINLGKGKGTQVNAVFDTTAEKNYIFSAACADAATCPTVQNKYTCTEPCILQTPGSAPEAVKLFGARLESPEATQGSDRVSLKGTYLGSVPFDFPKKFKDNSETKVVEVAPAGIALGFYEESKSFFENLKEGKIKLEHKGFSFVLAKNVESIYFGGPQLFFAKDSLTKFKNLGSTLGTGKLDWSIKIKEFKYKKAGSFVAPEPANHFANKKVFFDSTTKWTWVPNDILTQITGILQEFGQACSKDTAAPERQIYFCGCDTKYPNIQFQFEGSTKFFTLTKDDYIEGPDDTKKKCALLFRGQDNFGANANSAKVPDVSQGVFFGTSMLKALYTYFDVEHNSIGIAETAGFAAEKKTLNSTPRYLFIFLGAALAILSIAALLAILKKCPYDPTYVGKPLEKKEEIRVGNTILPVQQQLPPQVILRQSIPAQQVQVQQISYVYKQQSQQPNFIYK